MKRPWLIVFAVCAAAVVACGPSFQAIYEGDVRFEHCYALDDAPTVPLAHKADCWSEWTHHHTYGQTRDRVEYAMSRYRALAMLPALPTDEAMMGAAPGGERYPSITTPAPTSAFAPPPKTMADGDGGTLVSTPNGTVPTPPVAPTRNAPASPAPSARPPELPQNDCVGGCGSHWQACKDTCAGFTCAACDKGYGKCMKACF